jgi:hypothetical protein
MLDEIAIRNNQWSGYSYSLIKDLIALSSCSGHGTRGSIDRGYSLDTIPRAQKMRPVVEHFGIPSLHTSMSDYMRWAHYFFRRGECTLSFTGQCLPLSARVV